MVQSINVCSTLALTKLGSPYPTKYKMYTFLYYAIRSALEGRVSNARGEFKALVYASGLFGWISGPRSPATDPGPTISNFRP